MTHNIRMNGIVSLVITVSQNARCEYVLYFVSNIFPELLDFTVPDCIGNMYYTLKHVTDNCRHLKKLVHQQSDYSVANLTELYIDDHAFLIQATLPEAMSDLENDDLSVIYFSICRIPQNIRIKFVRKAPSTLSWNDPILNS